MRIYYSGNSSRDALPEVLLAGRAKPHIMLTYWDFHNSNRSTAVRFHKHRLNRAARDNEGAPHLQGTLDFLNTKPSKKKASKNAERKPN